MTVGPLVRYPSGPITKHGAYHILHNRIPQVALRSYDDTVVFNLMGGLAIPNRTIPERVQINAEDGLKGLIPPWQTIQQKGATQDGATFIDALYDPTEVEMNVIAHGRNPAYARKVVRDLIASIDAKETSELSWTTHELGRWWAKVRWFKTPVDSFAGGAHNDQPLSLRLLADDAFWRSYDCVRQFDFGFDTDSDGFDTEYEPGLGPDWTLHYSGDGGGYLYSNGRQAKWKDDPEDPVLTGGRTVVARRDDFETDTDNQVIEVRLGSLQEWSFRDTAYNDIWGRMAMTGDPGANGVRVRFGLNWIRLSYFVAGVETVLRQRPLLIPPIPGERFTLVCGFEGDSRLFKVKRNGIPIMHVKERGTGSLLGSSYRGTGFGMHAGAALITQATPAGVVKWSAGDNSTVTQTKFLEMFNVGDQPMWIRFTCFGPFSKVTISDGPNSEDSVSFGPLLENQVVQIRTDPRKRGVVDLTSSPASVTQQKAWQQALVDFVSFATGNNVPPLLQAIGSALGIVPPQGNLYARLQGRFSKPIPPKSPGQPAQPYHIKVTIDDGTADTAVIAAGTPLRRYPL